MHRFLAHDKKMSCLLYAINKGSIIINPLQTKRKLLYLKNQSIPRC